MNQSSTNEVETRIANLAELHDREIVVNLVNEYSRDEMGSGGDLPDEVRSVLGERLANCPSQVVFIAEIEGESVGVAVCFEAFSTFQAKPLINIHDLSVNPGHRGKGVGKVLLAAVEEEAKRRGCGKITLEVLAQNHRARHVYDSFGFEPKAGEPDQYFFMSKRL